VSRSPEPRMGNTQHQINKVSMETRRRGWGRGMELQDLSTQLMGSHSPVWRQQGGEGREWMEWIPVQGTVWSHVWRCVRAPQLEFMECVWEAVLQGVRSDGTMGIFTMYYFHQSLIYM